MATSFADIRDLIRATVLDSDASNYRYKDNALNSQINLQLKMLDNDTIYALTDPTTFLSDLLPKQALLLALPIAFRLVSGVPHEFSHRSPVLSVSRKGGARELASTIEQMIDDVEGNRCPIAADNEFNAIIQYVDRTVNGIDRATTAYNGSSSSLE